jgi:uncharacterized Ntn-hydrolase superfamily protein
LLRESEGDDRQPNIGLPPSWRAASVRIASQALVNPYHGIDGLKLLREAHEPAETLEMLARVDRGWAHR